MNVTPHSPSASRKIIVRSRLYDRKSCTTDCMLCPNGERIYTIKGVIYSSECAVGNDFYIGERGRSLVDKFKEHLSDIYHNYTRHGLWATHARIKHSGTFIPV